MNFNEVKLIECRFHIQYGSVLRYIKQRYLIWSRVCSGLSEAGNILQVINNVNLTAVNYPLKHVTQSCAFKNVPGPFYFDCLRIIWWLPRGLNQPFISTIRCPLLHWSAIDEYIKHLSLLAHVISRLLAVDSQPSRASHKKKKSDQKTEKGEDSSGSISSNCFSVTLLRVERSNG